MGRAVWAQPSLNGPAPCLELPRTDVPIVPYVIPNVLIHNRKSYHMVYTRDKRKSQYGLLEEKKSFVMVNGGGNCSVDRAGEAMGIDWMSKRELNEAIPPAYTSWIGRQLLSSFA